MRIAIISDVHANLAALESIQRTLRSAFLFRRFGRLWSTAARGDSLAERAGTAGCSR